VAICERSHSRTGDALLLCVGFELLQVEPERRELGVDELAALDIDQLERALFLHHASFK
jgi:hypothetical protein